MNITVLANRDLASNFALSLLLPILVKEHRVSVFLSGRVGGSAGTSPELEQLKLFEQNFFSFEKMAERLGVLPFETINKINTEQGLSALAATQPDLVLSVRYGGILKDAAIAIPSLGVLNLHSGPLPQYRGVMATFYAMLNREAEAGVTLHTIIDSGIDTGDIIGRAQVTLDVERSYLWNVLQLYPPGIELMLNAVRQLSLGKKLPSQPQNEAGNYYSFPAKQQLMQFKQMGYRLFERDEIAMFVKQNLEL